MKVLIIEDEQATALRLKKLLTEIDPEIEVMDILDSIESSVNWYQQNKVPELVFQDIQLADGSSFEIFKEIKMEVPVIFITAFDQYAIDAFKVNSVDYLLKPVNKTQLSESIEKFKRIHKNEQEIFDYHKLARIIHKDDFQKRFVVRYGQKIKSIETADIAYFYTDSGNNFFRTFNNETYPLDFSLDKLENMLNPDEYYRINRQFIIHIKSIDEMYTYSKSRVKIELTPPAKLKPLQVLNARVILKNG